MNLNLLSLRKVLCSATLAACGAIVLIAPAQAAQMPNSFYPAIRDSLVGQPKVEQSDDTKNLGRTKSEENVQSGLSSLAGTTYPAIRDSLVGQPEVEQSDDTNVSYPAIRDSLVGQPETAPKPALPAGRVVPEESSDLSDEIILAGTLVLALLMGMAITLAVGRMRERTA